MRRRMTSWLAVVAGMTMSVLAGASHGQFAPQPNAQLPPLLYLRLAGPQGMKVTLYRGDPAGVTFDAPCIVGLRPGYAYRVALSNIPGFPGATFSPTLEVRGSMWLTSQLRNGDFPATVMFRISSSRSARS